MKTAAEKGTHNSIYCNEVRTSEPSRDHSQADPNHSLFLQFSFKKKILNANIVKATLVLYSGFF